ncbi:MAG: SDR family oxidoreductase [Nitrospinaceae bacterium]|nr:SDR family oxidoreductase [Nitrospinaceae bacterium]NIR56798.1 SDR family oxidoreductase [Nitrospinaceae bacterium]NIS87254.1 SDR family oxidoreductase [Nitrospinaceae bacterium]NIT82408.1 SDR family oxidoreductase [Nitrospinaceae bacterium]NIU44621.1 SDR family oxidoreductase [Nitrospinaceae bacterium]
MQFDFTDQTVIVTGGTRGIGKGLTQAFLKAGATVIATYRSNATAAEEFRESQEACEDRLHLRQFDVGSHREVVSFYRFVEENFEKIDVLVNNSGIRRDSIVGMMAAEDWKQVIDTNLTGTYHMSKGAVQNMMRQKYGRIVNITSPIARFGFAGQANYAATKAGQEAFTRSLSKEVASRNITVNCVSPGFIDTDFIADLPDDQKARYLEMVPLKRFGTVEEVSRTVLFLAARESGYINGAVLEITGGL